MIKHTSSQPAAYGASGRVGTYDFYEHDPHCALQSVVGKRGPRATCRRDNRLGRHAAPPC